MKLRIMRIFIRRIFVVMIVNISNIAEYIKFKYVSWTYVDVIEFFSTTF